LHRHQQAPQQVHFKLLISINRKSKRTVILITHNPNYIQYADRIFWMQDGKVIKVEANANPITTFASTKEIAADKKSKENKKDDTSSGNENAPDESTQEKIPEKEDDFSLEEVE